MVFHPLLDTSTPLGATLEIRNLLGGRSDSTPSSNEVQRTVHVNKETPQRHLAPNRRTLGCKVERCKSVESWCRELSEHRPA